jgi:branched-chain amino acid transport system substrate-binding protein
MKKLAPPPERRLPKRISRFYPVLLAFLLLAASCHLQDDPAQRRVHYAEKSKEPIHLGVVWPFSVGADLFREGAGMALDEINQAGGVLGRKLEARFGDDRSSSHDGLVVAQDFAKDPRLLYVIGHCDTHVTQTASLIYQVNSILFITPGTTAFRSSRQGFDLVFNSYHTEEEIIGSLVYYCSRRNYQRIALAFQNTPYGSGLADLFENRAGELGMDIVARLPYDRPDPRVIRHMVETLHETEGVDVLFAAGLLPEIARVIGSMRRWGMTLPIVGVDDLDDDLYVEVAGRAAEGTVVPSSFDLSSPRPEVAAFARSFEVLHGKLPDPWAAQGYDAVNLLAFAIKQAGSSVPAKVAAALSRTRNWVGVTGPHTFNEEREAVGKPLVLKQVRDGKFVFLEEVVPAQPSGIKGKE